MGILSHEDLFISPEVFSKINDQASDLEYLATRFFAYKESGDGSRTIHLKNNLTDDFQHQNMLVSCDALEPRRMLFSFESSIKRKELGSSYLYDDLIFMFCSIDGDLLEIRYRSIIHFDNQFFSCYISFNGSGKISEVWIVSNGQSRLVTEVNLHQISANLSIILDLFQQKLSL